ncbi:HAD family hydrolase [Halobaculum sp. MBLA0143]|uniref:HAD family hydrolase n=1 Tax=Halobaculum sp. MBLA0143 TaxID=3079933 RepID=UPI003526715E
MTRAPTAPTDLGDPDGVTLDLDGTLVDYRRSPGELLAVAGDRVGVDPPFPVEAYYDRFDEFAERTDSMRELRRECFAALAAERDYDPETGRSLARAFAAERDHGNVGWCRGAERFLDGLDGRGVPYAVVTNGPRETQRQKLAAVGLDDRVEGVVFAGDDCPAKPDPEPIRRGLSVLGVGPERAVHVGDSGTDLAAARRAGVRAVIV